jgi:glycosyltransferase involved in cell wall biosynthesis
MTVSTQTPVPLISVVIPAYNAASTLEATLGSVLNQTWSNFEVIVVDDGSTDGTPQLLRSYGDQITVIRQPNGGLPVARMTGVAAAKGEFIALMDADDLCHTARLAVQARYLMLHPKVVLCSTDFSAFDAHGPTATSYSTRYYSAIGRAKDGIRSYYPKREVMPTQTRGDLLSGLPPVLPTYRGAVYESLAHGNFVHPPTTMFRRSIIQEIGNFDPAARSMCDWDWLSRAAQAGQFGYIDWPLLDYRLSASQMSSSRHRMRAMGDILHVAERICARDPALYLRDHQQFQHELAEYCLCSADARAQEQRGEALKLVLRSTVRYGRFSDSTLRILFKVLTPNWLIDGLRLTRKRDEQPVEN